MENNVENSGYSSLPVNRLTATDYNGASRAKITNSFLLMKCKSAVVIRIWPNIFYNLNIYYLCGHRDDGNNIQNFII